MLAVAGCSTYIELLKDAYDPGRYEGVAQFRGTPSLGPLVSFRFVEKWRLSHAWLQGTNVKQCRYPSNAFERFPQYAALANEDRGPMFDLDGRIYTATTFPQQPERILFVEKRAQVIGDVETVYGGRGYTPFCSDVFAASRHGLTVMIVKPNPAYGTDEWVKGATFETLNGRVWLVQRTPPRDHSATGLAAPIERWTLKIPETPYWLHLSFSASLEHSVRLHRAEHEHLLGLFHQIVRSVSLEPITPVDPASMPPIEFLRPDTFKPSVKKNGTG